MTDETKEFKSFFKTVGGHKGEKCYYTTRLDTYGCGCPHDCSYCYAKSLLEFRGLWDPQNPRVADINKIYKTIDKYLKEGDIVRLGGMTDCFQAKELKHRITYKTIERLNEKKIGYLIVTKSDIVARDEYIKLMDKDLAHIQVTITCTDDEFSKSYEKATPPSKRIKAIEKLQENGFDTFVRLSPVVTEFIDNKKLDLNIINNIKCDKAIVEFLRINSWIKKWFDIDFSQYTVSENNYLHLPLKVKQEYLNKITGFKEISLCEVVTEDYEYWKNNVNVNPNDCCNLKINK